MRGDFWAWIVGLSLFWAGMLTAEGQVEFKGDLHWSSGDVMKGEWMGVEEGWLKWKAEELAEPTRVWLPRTVGWKATNGGGASEMTAPWVVKGVEGSFFGCESWATQGVEWMAKTTLAGEIFMKREAVEEWRQKGRQGPLLYLGPSGMSGFIVMEGGASPEQRWVADSGELTTQSIDQSVALPLALPEKMRMDFWLRTDATFPQFRCKVRREGQGLELETWMEELMGKGDERAKRLGTLYQKELMVTVCVDFPGREAVAFDASGKEWGRWKVRGAAKKASSGGGIGGLIGALAGALVKGVPEKMDGRISQKSEIENGLILTNLGADLRLERLMVREWDGLPPMARPKDKAFVETLDGRVLAGEVRQTIEGKLNVKGESGSQELGMKEVAWVRVSPLNRKKPVVRVEGCPLEESLIVRGLDGSCFKGRIMDGSTDSVRIKTVMEDKPWEVSMKGVAELKWVALEPFAGAETDEMEAFDQWERGKLVTRGQWVPGEGGSPRWRVDGGDRAVPIRITDKWTIRRSVLGGTEGVMLPGLAHLDSGEIVPAEVVSWTEEEVKLRSLIAAEEETSRLPAEKVRALELAGEGLKVSGFQDPGWVMVREGEKGAKMDRVKGKVELSSGSLVGHGSFMQGTKLSFKVGSSQSYGALRVRLFADGLGEKSASLTLLVMRSGNTVYCGVEDPRHLGQIRGNTNRLPVEYEKPYDFSIRWSANQLQAWVNGMPAMTHALTDASRSGTGLLIEPAGLWGNSVQPQEVSHMRLDGATGARARPTMDSETRTWALQIPRRATENRPRHLLMAKNGDVLRGVVEEVNGEQVRLRSGLEMFEVPRERVALMVIPGEKVDDSTKGIEQKKTGPAIRFATADGAEFSLKAASLGPEWVEGDSPVLGKCRVRAELVRRLDSGEEHRHAGAFEGWNFVKAPDPLLPEETGGEGASLKGQAAPGFDLELASGGRFKLEDVKGKVVVLDFWASWCGPCLKAMPELLEAMKEFPNEKVLVVGVNQGQAMAEVKAFLKARKWELEVALDLDQKVGDLFGVKGIPHTVVVGPNGKVEWVSEGYSVAMAKELREVVLKLLP